MLAATAGPMAVSASRFLRESATRVSSRQIQLDFDAQPEPSTGVGVNAPMTVGELTQRISGLILADSLLQDVWVRGEISRYTRHSSGHHYFTLKDEQSVLSCVMWRGSANRLRFQPGDGMEVLAHGHVDLYERRGQYQLVVDELQPDGLGALFLAFEQTRQRLEAEGLFALERKRPLPLFPQRVAIITSRTAAALQDMLHILRRDPPSPEIVLVPALMQGEGAAASVCAAIERANRRSGADLLIVGRGGGSLEDLWTFNEEEVARAIAGSEMPVISGVGHESDTTLADYAADVRAPTPTAAAEIVIARRMEFLDGVRERVDRIRERVAQQVLVARHRYEAVAHHPLLSRRMEPVETRRQWLDDLEQRRRRAAETLLVGRRRGLEVLEARLETLSPLAVLRRGYAAVTRLADGRRLESVAAVKVEDVVRIDWADGYAESVISGVHPGDTGEG